MLKKLLLPLFALPLVFHAPYLYSAWRSSRLDQWDWIFYCLTIPAFFYAVRREKMGKTDYSGLFLVIPALVLSVLTPWHQVNALGIASAIGVIFGMFWVLGGWAFAYRILPVMFVLLAGTPSSSYHISLLLMVPVWVAWGIKFLCVCFCFVWIWCNKRYHWHIRRSTLLFSCASLFTGLLLLHTKEIYFEGKPFVPDFRGRAGDYFGRAIRPDENTKRFFVTSTVRQYRYTRDNTDISVLAVQCGHDIHEIHPASHCLRTSLWTVHSEQLLYLQDNFAVTEIDAQKGDTRCLIWVWFSSEDFSTPGFLGFRRHFKAGGKYFTYQISTVIQGDVGTSRKELQDFIRYMGQEVQR